MANYDANYDDERLTQVESDKSEALSDLEETYAGMINRSDKYFDKQIQATEKWADKQSTIQQEQTDFAIEQIEQQKAQTEKDYKKEQSGAYVDWQKQSNAYGVNAEKTAAAGLAGSGYSETMQVSMYNTYQQRVSAAREVFNMAVLDYNNAIKDARLQNNAALAQIAYEALQKKLELSLQGFQYKNQLILEKTNKKLEVENIYHSRYMDVLNQINTENALAEEVRQFEADYELKVKEYEEGIRQFDEEIKRLKEKDAAEHKLEIEKLELQKAQLTEEARQFDESAKLEREKLAASSSKSSSKGTDDDTTKTAIIPDDDDVATTGDDETGTEPGDANDKVTIDTQSLINCGLSASTSQKRLAYLVDLGVLIYRQVGNNLVFVLAKQPPKNSYAAAKEYEKLFKAVQTANTNKAIANARAQFTSQPTIMPKPEGVGGIKLK